MAIFWIQADEVNFSGGKSPVNYGWMKTGDVNLPVWFTGNPVLSSITTTDQSGSDDD